MVIQMVAALVLSRAADATWSWTVTRLVANRFTVKAFGCLDAGSIVEANPVLVGTTPAHKQRGRVNVGVRDAVATTWKSLG